MHIRLYIQSQIFYLTDVHVFEVLFYSFFKTLKKVFKFQILLSTVTYGKYQEFFFSYNDMILNIIP
jgi:hypothetical protein